MELLLENIEQSNQISQQEFGKIADWLYSSVAISHKDSALAYQKKEQRLDFLLDFLKDYYEEQVWESDDAEGDFLDFYARIKSQKEILQIVSGQIKLKDVQLAMQSFALKTQYPVGMR
jgi:ferritin